jgi:hypothetical protein
MIVFQLQHAANPSVKGSLIFKMYFVKGPLAQKHLLFLEGKVQHTSAKTKL